VVSAGALTGVRIVSVADRPRAAWAEGLRVLLPDAVLERTGWRRAIGSTGDLAVPASGGETITVADVEALRDRRAFTDHPPVSSRLPFRYHLVPGWARAAVGSAIGRWNRARVERWGEFPQWPIDLSTDLLDDLRDVSLRAPSGPPPATPVVVTHDIDSPEGLANLVGQFLPIEESVGARSTNYIVPCAWPHDAALMSELVARGHAVGVHGYDHSNRTPFAGAAERARRLDGARSFSERYQASGYRAPSLLRTRALLRDLSTRYRYDSSIPTTGGLFPSPNNGCATARPYLIESIAELPVTMPRDGLLRFLGYAPREILQLWIDCADLIARARGVVVLLTHCERRFSGHPGMLDVYRRFLEHVRGRSDRFAFSSPESIVAGLA
jgi:peptidoglycan/xylan/chitin deacetylase (PgdA/CDA1 family)